MLDDWQRPRSCRPVANGDSTGASYCAHNRSRGPGPNDVAPGIARALNDEGVPTPSGEGAWTAATVARLRQPLEQF